MFSNYQTIRGATTGSVVLYAGDQAESFEWPRIRHRVPPFGRANSASREFTMGRILKRHPRS